MSREDTTDHVDPITPFDEATDLAATDDARDGTDWAPNPRAGQLIQMLLLGAILLAPLLALLFRVEFALFIAAVALGMTAYLSLEGAKSAPPDKAKQMRLAAKVNIAGAVMAILILAWMLLNR